MRTAVERLQHFFPQVVEERAGILTRQERDDSIVYALYSSPCYATVVGCTDFTGERLQQVVAVTPVYCSVLPFCQVDFVGP